MDIGAARLLVIGFEPAELPPELDSTPLGDLARLGPGRADVLGDGQFNPYAFPDMGGLADMPFLHHNANWRHTATVTLAVRCETLFITSASQQSRIPRVLSYAIAAYFRSLAPPPPVTAQSGELEAEGEQHFEQAGCVGCHTPPLYTSDRSVSLEDVGTNPSAGESPVRATGYYRIPSLRGVGRAAPYLHDGSISTLEGMFTRGRKVPGHPWGQELEEGERAALLAFLRSL